MSNVSDKAIAQAFFEITNKMKAGEAFYTDTGLVRVIEDRAAELDAQQPAQAQGGWVLVPRVPTPEMLSNIGNAITKKYGAAGWSKTVEVGSAVWRQMIAASPTSPEASKSGADGGIAWSEKERAAITELMSAQELSYAALLRQAVRLYQADWMRRRNGETCRWSGDEQRASEFYTPAADVPVGGSPELPYPSEAVAWVRKAYNCTPDTKFTIWNMEVAYAAGYHARAEASSAGVVVTDEMVERATDAFASAHCDPNSDTLDHDLMRSALTAALRGNGGGNGSQEVGNE